MTCVGYLDRSHSFPRGKVTGPVLVRLIALAKVVTIVAAGYHDCEIDDCDPDQPQEQVFIDGFLLPRHSDREIFVPDGSILYQAPILILHYIFWHDYCPPEAFLDAVMKCPLPGSPEYIEAMAPHAEAFPFLSRGSNT